MFQHDEKMWITFKDDYHQCVFFHNAFFWYNNCKFFPTKKRTVYLIPQIHIGSNGDYGFAC